MQKLIIWPHEVGKKKKGGYMCLKKIYDQTKGKKKIQVV